LIAPNPIGNLLLPVLEMRAPESRYRCGHRRFKIALEKSYQPGRIVSSLLKCLQGNS
jgi:hypothetical protein